MDVEGGDNGVFGRSLSPFNQDSFTVLSNANVTPAATTTSDAVAEHPHDEQDFTAFKYIAKKRVATEIRSTVAICMIPRDSRRTRFCASAIAYAREFMSL